MQHAIALDGESGKMRVGDSIGRGIAGAQQFLKEWPMLIRRVNQPHTALFDPALHALDRLLQRSAGVGGGEIMPMRTKAVSTGQHNATGSEPVSRFPSILEERPPVAR